MTTYILSATAYPVEVRGSGHGFIAVCKFGAIFTMHSDSWGYKRHLLLAIFIYSLCIQYIWRKYVH